MSLIRKKTRITARRVAEIIGCSEKTVYNRGAGTDQLTRIRNGRRQIRFILEEVLAFTESQEKEARQSHSARNN
jgi:predicted DNA-binding transcriptional regulator AlpA